MGKTGDQVQPANVGRLLSETMGNHIDRAIKGEPRGNDTDSPPWRQDRLVGESHLDENVADRDVVRVGQTRSRKEGHRPTPVEALATIASIAKNPIAHCQDAAII